MAVKLYESEKWLRFQHYTVGRSVNEMAGMCKVSHMTIRRWMDHFSIKVVK